MTNRVRRDPAGRHSRWAPLIALGVVLAIGLAVRVLNVATMSRLPVASYQLTWTSGDMAGHWEWSSRIVAGDVLGRNPPHPYTSWMRQVAPLEVWERWWGGEKVFHKAPLYPYLLAATRWLFGDDVERLTLCQALVGLLAVALCFALGARLFDTATGVVAGLGAALYGPFLFHEALLLRDGLAVTTSLLMLWGLARCDERASRWWFAGFLFAVALLAREATVLFAPFVVLLVAKRYRRDLPGAAVALASFAGGAVLALAPLVARNLVVGVKPWSISAIAVENIIYGHVADGAPVGFYLSPLGIRVLREAQGRLLPTIQLTLASYQGDIGQLLQHELLRLRAIFSPFEMWDNANWYYFRDRSAVLRHAIQPEVLLPLGLVGLAIDRTDDRRRILRYFLLSVFLSLMTGSLVARYRLPAMGVLAIYAAAASTSIARQAFAGAWRSAFLVILATVLVAIASTHLLGTRPLRGRYRALEYMMAADFYIAQDDSRASDELRDGLVRAYRGPDQPTLPAGYIALLDRLIDLSSSDRTLGATRRIIDDLGSAYPRDDMLRERALRVASQPIE